MKIVNYREPKSSFLSMEKDLSLIVDVLLKNKNLYFFLKKVFNYS
jgi:hypothetical protein